MAAHDDSGDPDVSRRDTSAIFLSSVYCKKLYARTGAPPVSSRRSPVQGAAPVRNVSAGCPSLERGLAGLNLLRLRMKRNKLQSSNPLACSGSSYPGTHACRTLLQSSFPARFRRAGGLSFLHSSAIIAPGNIGSNAYYSASCTCKPP